MTTPVPTELDRIRFWQGQRLRGRDFRDQTAAEAQLRWWHNRALHNAFGVRFGFKVEPVAGDDSIVEIGCGLAYDCFGRELILQTGKKIELPAINPDGESKITLIARYKETTQFRSKRELSGVCATSPETPGFLWKRSSEVQLADGVPIARWTYDSQHVPVPDVTFSAPRARALARPRVGSGMTVPGHTAWEPWSERVLSLGRVMSDMQLGVQVTIDTSAAGFTETPRYFAWLEGSLWDRSNIQFFPAPFAHIDDNTATANQFRFRLWMPNLIALIGNRVRLANQHLATEFLNFAQRKNLYVCWLGAQCNACPECNECIETRECRCETGENEWKED